MANNSWNYIQRLSRIELKVHAPGDSKLTEANKEKRINVLSTRHISNTQQARVSPVKCKQSCVTESAGEISAFNHKHLCITQLHQKEMTVEFTFSVLNPTSILRYLIHLEIVVLEFSINRITWKNKIFSIIPFFSSSVIKIEGISQNFWTKEILT